MHQLQQRITQVYTTALNTVKWEDNMTVDYGLWKKWVCKYG